MERSMEHSMEHSMERSMESSSMGCLRLAAYEPHCSQSVGGGVEADVEHVGVLPRQVADVERLDVQAAAQVPLEAAERHREPRPERRSIFDFFSARADGEHRGLDRVGG